jgi:hypothetical protein
VLALLDRISRRLMHRGLRQGLLEGSALWLVVGAAAWLVRLLVTPEPPKVVSEQLALGESVIVTHLPPGPTRRQARRAAGRTGDPTAEGA